MNKKENIELNQTTVSNDPVNHPNHYTQGGIETINFIIKSLGKEGAADYCLGNVIKYVSRAKFKENELQDVKKAQWYLNKAVELKSEIKNS